VAIRQLLKKARLTPDRT